MALKRDSWLIAHERATIVRRGDSLACYFYGLPSHLWSLRSKVVSWTGASKDEAPASVDVVEYDGLAAMLTCWPARFEDAIASRAKDLGIEVGRA